MQGKGAVHRKPDVGMQQGEDEVGGLQGEHEKAETLNGPAVVLEVAREVPDSPDAHGDAPQQQDPVARLGGRNDHVVFRHRASS